MRVFEVVEPKAVSLLRKHWDARQRESVCSSQDQLFKIFGLPVLTIRKHARIRGSLWRRRI
jgi:hypothetical protein